MSTAPTPPIGGTPIVTPQTWIDFLKLLRQALDELIRQLEGRPAPPPPPPPPGNRPPAPPGPAQPPRPTVGGAVGPASFATEDRPMAKKVAPPDLMALRDQIAAELRGELAERPPGAAGALAIDPGDLETIIHALPTILAIIQRIWAAHHA